MAINKDKIIGIDLGTTNSVVAYIEGDEPKIIFNSEGMNKTPSVVGFFENNEIVVGEIAKRQFATNPKNTIFNIKRLMGRFYSEIIQNNELNLFNYDIINKDNLVYLKINELGYTPQQISAIILKSLKNSASAFLGEEVTQAVITVPAYFDDLQRQATIEAGNLAGLEVLRLINEPTAAAMAYGLGKEAAEVIAVYDFGGGTFDVSILESEKNAFEVLTTIGDTHLGGMDLDYALLNFLCKKFNDETGYDLTKDPIAYRRLLEASEKAKCELSLTQNTLISLPFITAINNVPIHFEMKVTRAELESLIQEHVDRTIKLCKNALKEVGLKTSNIDKVILVGGTSRIPMIQDAVEDFFNIPPYKGINPDEIVAMGAATQAGILSGSLQEVVLMDVTPHTLGIETVDNSCSAIIEKNSTIPTSSSKTFTTTEDNQDFVIVNVLQGESKKASENKSLGSFILKGIEKTNAGSPRIKVNFFINSDGIVDITAYDVSTKSEEKITITHRLGGEDKELKSKTQRKQRVQPNQKGQTNALNGVNLSDMSSIESLQGNKITVPDQKHAALEITPTLQKDHSPKEIKKEEQEEVKENIYDTPIPEDSIDPSPAKDETQSYFLKYMADNSQYKLPHIIAELEKSLFIDNILKEEFKTLPEDIIDEYKKLIKKYPDRIENHIALALIYNECGMSEECKDQINTIIKSYPRDDDLILKLLSKLLDKFPNYDTARFDRAHYYKKSNNIDAALMDLELLFKKNPKDADVYHELTDIYKEKFEQTKDVAYKMKLVKIYIQNNNTDLAISLLQELIEIPEYQLRATKILGLCFWEKGLYYLAWQKFKALPLNDELCDILYRLSFELETQNQINYAYYALERIYSKNINYKDVAQRMDTLKKRLEMKGFGKKDSELDLDDPRFEIIEEINRGNMGVVYKAKDKSLEDIVALKVLNSFLASDASSVRRFKTEARAAKKLSHTNIVRIHDFYESPTKKFISMEYIEGKDLKTLIKDNNNISEQAIVEYWLQIAKALGYAHKLGVIHRDIKPANIMINQNNEVKITDFGIAKIMLANEKTKTGTQVMGTPLYMSPEQIQGIELDGRSDIYSCGVMMYELISGEAPFSAGNVEYQHVNIKPPAIYNTKASEEFKRIIMKCLEKEPEKRYQNADELIHDLENLYNNYTA